MKMLMTSVVLLSNCLVPPRIKKIASAVSDWAKHRKYEGQKVENKTKTDDKHDFQTACFSPSFMGSYPFGGYFSVDHPLIHTNSHLTLLERLLTRKVFLKETVGVLLEVEEQGV